MNNTRPLFSIIIPTVNRVHEFKSTLNTVISENYENLEIIIQDNATEWGLQKYVNNINDKRIIVNRLNERLFMADNWENAINFSSGSYVTILGDDDGWYKGSLQFAESIINRSNEIEVLNWNRDDYGWPDAVPSIKNTMKIHYKNNIQILSPDQLLNKIFNYQLSHEYLPKIYSSFYSRKFISRLNERFGSLFLDPNNPDISSGVQSLIIAEKIFRSEVPFSIIGTSGSSNGAASSFALTRLMHNKSVGKLNAHHTLGNLYNIGCTADLSILNTYLKISDILSLKNINVNSELGLLSHLESAPSDAKPEIYRELQRMNIFDENTITNNTFKILMSDKFIRPIDRPSQVDSYILLNNGFESITNVSKIGIDDIAKASSFSLYLRDLFYNIKNTRS